MAKWIGREMRPADNNALMDFVARAPRPASLFVKAAAARGKTYTGWWYGAWRDGTSLEAVMAVDNHQGAIYADNEDAAKGFAEELYGMQKRLGSGGTPHRHQLICETKMMNIIWPIMKELPGRKLLADRDCDLLQSHPEDDTAAPSGRVGFEVATRADERVVFDFAAELRIEQMGIDPRKIGRDAHAQRIADTIAAGRELIAKEKDSGRPFFVAELQEISPETIVLSEAYVPPHYRARGKLIAQAFFAASRHPAVAGKELVYLGSDAALSGAAKAAGWKRISGYRWAITHG